MKGDIQIDLRNRWTLEQAMEYVKDREQPEHFSLTWLIGQLPDGVGIEFPRVTETYPDLNAEKKPNRR